MKKLLLLSVLVVFSCSGGDDNNENNNSNQTFLERYDGIVWEDNSLSGTQYLRTENDTTNMFTEYLSNSTCQDWQDVVAEFEMDFNITTNIGDNLSYSFVTPSGDGNDVFIIAMENGNALEFERIYYFNYANQDDFMIQIDTLVRSSFEIPCN